MNKNHNNFIKGVDISSLIEMQDKGFKFYNFDGKETDPFILLKENGVNYVRLRIWNEPENVPESGGYCNTSQTIQMAKRIHEHGLGFFLDFHYSDWWADPGQQNKPKSWERLTQEELVDAVYDYTKNVLEQLWEAGTYPDMVQIGNEIRSGMLFPNGAVPNWKDLSDLINAGIKAVRDTQKNNDVKIVIHLDQGGRYYYFEEWFDHIIDCGVYDFDIIGLSYYPFWHGTFMDFANTMHKLVERYNKPLIVAETAHAWRVSNNGFIGKEQEEIAGFDARPSEQKKVLELIMNITAAVQNEMGLGIFYWEPLSFPDENGGGWGNNMGLITPEGKPMEGLKAFLFHYGDKKNDSIVKVYEPKKIVKIIGEKIELPSKIRALTWEGNIRDISVSWKLDYYYPLGCYKIEGKANETALPIYAELEVVHHMKETYNYIQNASFENEMAGWILDKDSNNVNIEIRSEDEASSKSHNHYLHFEALSNFKLAIYRKAVIKNSGNYFASLYYRGDNTTGVHVNFVVEQGENRYETIIYPTDDDWVKYEINKMNLVNGEVKIGIWVSSPPIYGDIKEICLEITEN